MSLFHTQQGSGRARCGIASIEFAVIVPAMLTLMLGTFEFINAWRVQQKLNTAAGQLVEMIAAQSKVTEGSAEGPGGSLGDFCTAASYNMYPYPMNTLSGWVESTTEQSTGSNGHPQDWANDTSCPASIRSGSFAETIALTGIANQPR
jgi:Flp pilus assembly protein TadG